MPAWPFTDRVGFLPAPDACACCGPPRATTVAFSRKADRILSSPRQVARTGEGRCAPPLQLVMQHAHRERASEQERTAMRPGGPGAHPAGRGIRVKHARSVPPGRHHRCLTRRPQPGSRPAQLTSCREAHAPTEVGCTPVAAWSRHGMLHRLLPPDPCSPAVRGASPAAAKLPRDEKHRAFVKLASSGRAGWNRSPGSSACLTSLAQGPPARPGQLATMRSSADAASGTER